MDRAARRARIVVGPRDRNHLDFLNLFGPQRTQIGEQLIVRQAQLAVVDVDFRAAFAVDGDLFVVDPDARRELEQLDPVFADGRGGIGDVDYETVGFAPDDLPRYDDPFDFGGGAPHPNVAQIGVAGYPDRPVDGFVTEKLHRKGVVARQQFQIEASFGIGRLTGRLLRIAQQNDRRIGYGAVLIVDDVSGNGGRSDAGGLYRQDGAGQNRKNEQSFHFMLSYKV